MRLTRPDSNDAMIKFGFGLLLLLIPFDLLSQSFTPNPDWRFENFNSENHFVNSEIADLALDKYGYIWTCSRGVQRFDGYKTIDFNSFDRSKGALKDNYADVIADNDGRIWVTSAGLCYYDDVTSKFIYVQPDPKHIITYVNACLVQKNYLWFVCNYGLVKLDVHTLKLSYTSINNVINPLGTFILDENTLLISSREKAYIYNIKNNTYCANTLVYKNSLLKIFTAINSGKDIIVGTNRGLFILKNLYNFWPEDKETADIEIDDAIFLPEDKERTYLFLATAGKGIIVYNTILKKAEFTYTHDDNNPYSLPSNIISKFTIDKKNRVWIGTGFGISMLDVANQQWKTRFINKNNVDELYINKVLADKYDSCKLWMSSYNQGIFCMNWKTKKIDNAFDKNPELLHVSDFVQLTKNKWILVTSKSIIEWSPMSGILSKKALPVPDSLILKYNIQKIITADNNACFITTNRGLFKYDMITRKVTVAIEDPEANTADEVLKYDLVNGFDVNGILWIASKGGLLSYNIIKQKTAFYRGPGTISDYYFFNITKAIKNQILCASGDGLTIFNTQTKKFRIENTLANLYKPDCESVISVGNMAWINSEAGIINYNLDTHISTKPDYDTPLKQIFPGSPFAMMGNNIVVGFRNGFSYFTPLLKKSPLPSNPVIERVYVNNQPLLQQYPAGASDQKLTFGPTNNSINISFTAFLYTDPSNINFRYLLKGANSKWQYTVDQRSANYSQLPPGDYTFYIQSGNKNGFWNNKSTSFSFVITPPYWATWWFRLLVVLVTALCLYSLYRYRINNILAIQRIREKIASDFHDDIGSALSSISIFSEVADKQLQQQLPPEQTREIIGHISFHSRAMLDAMDDIVWAVNPQNDHINDLAVRMREFAIPLLEARNIQFEINIQEDILNTRIKMHVRKNMFLIFKECINNILKHADCSIMKVDVNRLNNQFELIINDNGKGFDINVLNTRNGLKNMHKRAVEINGSLHVTTEPGNGTLIRLLFNTI